MPSTQLVVRDQCNVAFVGLDPAMRRKICEALKFKVPNAKYTPQFKLGRWDGTVSFCTLAGATYLNLLDRILPIIRNGGYEIKIDDHRTTFLCTFPEITETLFAHRAWPIGHALAGEPIILRDYQVGAIQTFTRNIQCLQEITTAGGKTLITAALSSLVEPYGRSIVVVPSKSLVRQTAKDYHNLGLDVGLFFGEKKEWGHTHTIATWQSLASLAKQKHAENTIQQFVEGVTCVMIDEAHSIRGKVLKDLLTGPLASVPIRWGLTGTIPKEDHEWIPLLATIGNVAGSIRAADLQKQSVLANCKVEVVQLIDDHVKFSDYDSEHNFLVTDDSRLDYIADLLRDFAKTGNTLLLVDRIETGERLHAMLPDSSFVWGDTKTKDRQTEYDAIQAIDGKIIIATYGVASVGIDIPRLFNVVLLEAGKSFIRCIQAIGRGLRKAKDKDHVRIVDLCSTLHFSKRHLSKRKRYYNEAQYPHATNQVAYR